MSSNSKVSEAVAGRFDTDSPDVAERGGRATGPAVVGHGPQALQPHAVPAGPPRRPQPGCSRAARHPGEGLEWFLE
jgi:hypothetical protein